MLVPLFVTLLPVAFLAGLIRKALVFRRRHVDMGGEPPISEAQFAVSKYAIVLIWGAMVAQSWGGTLSFVDIPDLFTGASLGLWVPGFALLFTGRSGLGDSFRIGSPKESTGVPTRNSEPLVAVADLGRRLIPFPASIFALFVALLAALRSAIRSRLEFEAEILALRHQLAVLQRQAPKRPRLGRTDRLLWVLLSRL